MIAIKVAAIVTVGLVCRRALRSRSAAYRHALLAAFILTAGVLPLLERVVPGWGLRFVAAPAADALAAAVRRDAVAAICLAGSFVAIVDLIAGLGRLMWHRSRATESVDGPWVELLDQVATDMAVNRTVRVFETPDRLMPLTFGFLRPVVLVPATSREWSDERRRDVLRHELAHIKRADWLVNLLVEIVSRLYWFVPPIWTARKWLRIESECACDDAVLNLGVQGHEYASHLVGVARELHRNGGRVPAPAMSAARLLEIRVGALLRGREDRAPVSFAACSLIAGLALIVSAAVAGFGRPPSTGEANVRLLDVQRAVLMRFGGEERRFSIVTRDVSFWQNRIEGRVELQARLNADGSVSGVHAIEPVHPDLANAAETIVRNWRREPARVRGVPVAVPIRMTVDFTK